MLAFGEVAERLRRSTVQVFTKGHGAGSGVIWGADGLIITNAHVIRSANPEVELWDGRRFDARISSRDPRRDLSSLRVPAADLPAARRGDSAAVRPGELAIAIGSPLGFAGALTTGVIHSVDRKWLRANVRLAPGNSGGPLANAQGEVIGINTAVVNGLGLAVPSRDVADFLRHGARPRIGVELQAVALSPRRLGMLILNIEPESPAAAASLRVGDILVGVNGHPLESMDSLSDALDSGASTLRLQFVRGDRNRVRETVAQLKARAEAA
ncbi:MAG TPA: trypsin-like peptidase domain-containing protein [Bryobacteraceae bacterium]|nr:trypsin-like peptidase domain-containing protein [Bryobacteraceae bacterium]